MTRIRAASLTAWIALCAVGLSPLAAEAKTDLWIYSSVYKEFIEPIGAAFEKKNPDASVQVFQGGSEKIQAKVEAELVANRPQADFIMTSDPFWGFDVSKRGLALPQPGKKDFQVNYYSLMVMIANKNYPDRPKTWEDLADPKFKGLVQMGSPLESGTMFAAVAYLVEKFGWGFFDKLRVNDIASSGGNSAVIEKVESGEKKIGMVLLENALAARKRGSPIEIIYPSDGGVPIPSVQFILKLSPHPDLAKRFSAFLLSVDGQKLLRAGYMYPVNPKVPGPEGALPFKQATKGSLQWTDALISKVAGQAKEIKNKFSELILE